MRRKRLASAAFSFPLGCALKQMFSIHENHFVATKIRRFNLFAQNVNLAFPLLISTEVVKHVCGS